MAARCELASAAGELCTVGQDARAENPPRPARPVALVVLVPTVARADTDYSGGPDENRDLPTPGAVPADTRPSELLTATATADSQMTIFAAAVVRNPIDDFRYDALVLEGTAREVCAGRLLTGSGWAFNEIVGRFGGSAGTMYFCRERWDTATDPSCNGQQANPVTTPNFFSECWSNHARGRAIDVMVGTVGGGYNTNRGISIVNWLLARDAQGHLNSNARKLGIQQILFADRCWNSDGDRGISSWAAMRECGIGHHDHVHLDLTIDGANGNVSYWGRAPKFAPKLDSQVFWDQHAAWRQAVSWWNLVATDEEGLAVPAGYDRAIVGDWSGDGVQDEVFLWDIHTGNWIVQSWENGDSLNARIGRVTRGYDEIIAGDWDNDGRVDDMMIWDRDTGNYVAPVVVQLRSNVPRSRRLGSMATTSSTPPISTVTGESTTCSSGTGRPAGGWSTASSGYRPTYRSTRDLDTDVRRADRRRLERRRGHGRDDHLGPRHGTLGAAQLGRLPAHLSTQRLVERGVDIAAPGDYDTDGRVDDLFIYDAGNGKWAVWSFHRNNPSVRLTGRLGSRLRRDQRRGVRRLTSCAGRLVEGSGSLTAHVPPRRRKSSRSTVGRLLTVLRDEGPRAFAAATSRGIRSRARRCATASARARTSWLSTEAAPSTALWRPPGHFYSPVVSVAEVEADAQRIWPQPSPQQLPGIDLRLDDQVEILGTLAKYHDEFPPYRAATDRWVSVPHREPYVRARRRRAPLRLHATSATSADHRGRLRLLVGGDARHRRALSRRTSCPDVHRAIPDRLYSILRPSDRERVDIVVQRVQDVDVDRFDELTASDILVIDSSHVAKTGSDVNHLYFEVLPRSRTRRARPCPRHRVPVRVPTFVGDRGAVLERGLPAPRRC